MRVRSEDEECVSNKLVKLFLTCKHVGHDPHLQTCPNGTNAPSFIHIHRQTVTPKVVQLIRVAFNLVAACGVSIVSQGQGAHCKTKNGVSLTARRKGYPSVAGHCWQQQSKNSEGNRNMNSYIIHLNTATCKWWVPFILVGKAMFQMGKMYQVEHFNSSSELLGLNDPSLGSHHCHHQSCPHAHEDQTLLHTLWLFEEMGLL